MIHLGGVMVLSGQEDMTHECLKIHPHRFKIPPDRFKVSLENV